MIHRFLAALPALLLAGSALAADTMPAHIMNGMLTTPQGMTLYTFDQDGAGKSACAGPCAQNWPPFAAPADAHAMGDWSVVTRDDGGHQWAYKGKPLYTWMKDMKPGDATGDGVKGMWHTAKP
ncbi:MAG: hypothetical protein ACM31L_08360 [Actinomycetota bacterium]